MNKIFSVDYDKTLEAPQVQKYVKELLKKGIKVQITTSRFDDKHLSIMSHSGTNNDLYNLAYELEIPEKDIIFLNKHLKCEYFRENCNVRCHLDDSTEEVICINGFTKTRGVWLGDANWEGICNKSLGME